MKRFAWFAFILVIATYILQPIQDPDLGWNITVGRWIVANLKVPTEELWNRFALGKEWIAYSWSNEVVLALVDQFFALKGLFILKFIIILFFTISLFYFYGRISRDYFFGSLLGCLAACATYNHITLRPQLITWILLITLLFVLDEIENRGLSKYRIACLIIVFSLWSNTHLSAIIGLVTVFMWLFVKEDPKLSFIALGYSILGTFITPYFGKEWLTFFSKADHPLQMSQIAEFSSATILQFPTAFLIISVVLLITFLHFKPTVISECKIILCMIFVGGSLAVIKFIPQAVIILCACTAVAWRKIKTENIKIASFTDSIEKFRSLYNFIPLEGLTFVFIALSICNFYPRWNELEIPEAYPKPAIDFFIENDLPHPIMSTFGAGGHLMYRFSDQKGNLEHKVALDGRTNVNKKEIWEAFIDASQLNINWQNYFNLVEPETVIWKNGLPLTTMLLHENEWCRVFLSGDKNKKGFSVFVKRDFWLNHQSLESDNCSPKVDDKNTKK